MEQLSVKQKEEQWVAALLHTVDQLARIHHSARLAHKAIWVPDSNNNTSLLQQAACIFHVKMVYLDFFSRLSLLHPLLSLSLSGGKVHHNMPLLALGHKMALSLLTLMLGGALTTKPRATKRDATDMIRSLGFGLCNGAESNDVQYTRLY